jgi:hypothetical protein
MKHRHILWPGILVLLAIQAHANFDDSDDFNDDSKNTQLWGVDYTYGSGRINETNQHLEYTTSGAPTAQDQAGRLWIGSSGSYTQNWDLIVELSVGAFALSSVTQTVGCEITLFPGTDGALNRLSVELDQFQNSRRIVCNLASGGVQTEISNSNTTAVAITVRVSYDNSTHVLSAFFDGDGRQCGWRWFPLASVIVPAGWGMTPTTEFNFALGGHSRGVAVLASDAVFADSLVAASVVGPPLQIERTGQQVILSWPTNISGFHLEAANGLLPADCWTWVTDVPAVVGSNFRVTNMVTGQSVFYRLSR